MDMYGQVANTYSQELQNGVRLQSALDMQGAQQPQQLFDRFMNAYQQEYLRRRQEQEMARKQQHEDTYLKMAQTREDRANDEAKANFASWVSKNYKEGRDDGVAVLLGKAAGLDENAVKAMLPKGKWGSSGGGEAISEPGSEGAQSLAQGDMPLPTGARGPIDIIMPQTPAQYSPGMGHGVAYQEGEQARKQADVDRKVKHDQWKEQVSRAELAVHQAAQASRSEADRARAAEVSNQAEALRRRIDSGEFDLKDDLLRAQINNFNSLIQNRGGSTTKPVDAVGQEGKLYRMAEKLVPKDQFGNRDPKAVKAQVEKLRTSIPGASPAPKAASSPAAATEPVKSVDPLIGKKTSYPDGTRLKDGRIIRVDADGVITGFK